jgi:hypothetical protein
MFADIANEIFKALLKATDEVAKKGA